MRLLWLALCLAAIGGPAQSQSNDSAVRIAAQREAIARLSFLDGTWQGTAWSITPAGRHELTQTERAGASLDGAVRMIEGRGYSIDGRLGFNALGIVSYDPGTRAYSLTAWAMGQQGKFPLRLTGEGFVWETPAGPGETVRYMATVQSGRWREIGERIVEGSSPQQIFEMNLRRIGATDWPGAGFVSARGRPTRR